MAPVVALRRPFVGIILDGVGRHLIPFRYSPPQAEGDEEGDGRRPEEFDFSRLDDAKFLGRTRPNISHCPPLRPVLQCLQDPAPDPAPASVFASSATSH